MIVIREEVFKPHSRFDAWSCARSFWSVMVANGHKAVMSGDDREGYVVKIYA